MTLAHIEKPAPVGSRNGFREIEHAGKLDSLLDTRTAPKLQDFVDLDALEAVANWKDDLRSRLARAELIFELVEVKIDFEPLVEEVEQFKRVCRALMWRPKGGAA